MSSRIRALTASSTRRDALAIGFLVVLPLAMYLPMTIAGAPPMPGDDLNQNFPLRVLVGEILRSGKLPGWDPFIWSGTPLLAGWNAGAMFPGTWLFAVLPHIAAWILNFVAVPVLAGIGTYVLLRTLRCGSLASLLGALVFSYTGFMSGQIVHIGLAQGTACMPWILVGLEGLARTRDRRAEIGYGALLAVAVGLNILAADPRAVSSAAIAAGIYLLACCVRLRGDSLAFVAKSLAAAVLGAGLSAVQWAPGLSFLHTSQRSQDAYDFFGAGSLAFNHVLSLVLTPFLLGANGNFGMPVYQGNYNLPEVTVGVGLVALVALMHYLPDVIDSAARWIFGPRHGTARASTEPQRFGVWFVLVLVGLLLALGTTTPLGHLLVHLPLFAGERLQNRNAVLFDLALSVLVGYYVQERVARNATAPMLEKGQNRSEVIARRALCLLPPLGAIGLIVVAYLAPIRLEKNLGVPVLSTSLFHSYNSYLLATIACAAVLAAFVLLEHRLPNGFARVVLFALVCTDVGMFIAQGDYSSVPASALSSTSASGAELAAYTGSEGRFAIYNPALALNIATDTTLVRDGVVDLNILHKSQSVQGYGSIVNDIYQSATATHSYEDIDVARLSGVSFNTLDLKSLLSLPLYFGESLPNNAPIPLSNGQVLGKDNTPTTSDTPVALPPYAASAPGISVIDPATFTMVRPEPIDRVQVVVTNSRGANPSLLSIGVRDANGTLTEHAVPLLGDVATLALHPSSSVASLVINAPERTHALAEAVVVTYPGRAGRFVLNGSLQGALLYPHWRYAGLLGPLVVYSNSETAGYAWLQPARDKTPNPSELTNGTVQVSSSPIVSQKMTVDSPGDALLVRSEGYAPGWSARLRPLGPGRACTLPVHRFGLVQAVDLPAGKYTVTWTYAPRGVIIGLVVSFISTFVLLLVAIGVYVIGRRRARTGREFRHAGAAA